MGKFYITFNTETKTNDMPDFSPIVTIGEHVLQTIFRGSTYSGAITFPNLVSIGAYGLHYAFYDSKNITSASFPKLTTIGNYGIEGIFYGCTKITQVHFKSSLRNNSQCTKSNMGCSNATIYFDL